MKVAFTGPCSVGALLWQDRPGGAWQLSILCKVTYALAPGISPLAEPPEELTEKEGHWDDDPKRSVHAPNDLVPFKRRADVVLVGHAYAPRGEAVRSIVARLLVGSVDKAVEVCADRLWAQDGSLREGPRFAKSSLRYERAGGGPDTQNPVGVSPAGPPDTYGQLIIPNLQPPGQHLSQRGELVQAIGFGPIAASWPGRAAQMGGLAGMWSDRNLPGGPLPVQLDREYFNVAPRDQQSETMIRPDERIVLENLHPEHPRLVTNLAGVRPAAIVERAGRRMDLHFAGDTLWIDTDQQRCTVTFRAVLALGSAADEGLVHVALAAPGQAGFPEGLQSGWANAVVHGGDAARSAATPLLASQVGAAQPPSMPPLRHTSTLPVWEARDSAPNWLRPGGAPPAPPAPVAPPAPSSSPTPSSGSSAVMLRESPWAGAGSSLPISPPASQAPVSPPASQLPISPPPLSQVPISPLPISQMPIAQPSFVPPIGSEPGGFAGSFASLSSAAEVREVGASSSSPGIEEASARGSGGAAEGSRGSWGAPKKGGGGASSSAAQASDAAAQASRRQEQRASVTSEASERSSRAPQPSGAVDPQQRFELLWHDPEVAARVQKDAVYRQRLAGGREAGSWSSQFFSSSSSGRTPADERRDIARILARTKPLDGDAVERTIEASFDEDGLFTEPLGVVQGTIQLPFDERAQLSLLIEVVSPLAVGDKKLRDLLDAGTEALKAPPTDLFDGMGARIKAAFAQGVRAVPPSYIDDAVDRVLLHRRSFQVKNLLGKPRLRAIFSGSSAAGSSWSLVAYLPESAGAELPLFSRFKAIALAELRRPQDHYETSPNVLMILALARSV
jgi:hypothetical protein